MKKMAEEAQAASSAGASGSRYASTACRDFQMPQRMMRGNGTLMASAEVAAPLRMDFLLQRVPGLGDAGTAASTLATAVSMMVTGSTGSGTPASWTTATRSDGRRKNCGGRAVPWASQAASAAAANRVTS